MQFKTKTVPEANVALAGTQFENQEAKALVVVHRPSYPDRPGLAVIAGGRALVVWLRRGLRMRESLPAAGRAQA